MYNNQLSKMACARGMYEVNRTVFGLVAIMYDTSHRVDF